MTRIDEDLLKRLQDDPFDHAHLLVKTDDIENLENSLQTRGVKVRNRWGQINAVEIDGINADALGLLEHPNVMEISEMPKINIDLLEDFAEDPYETARLIVRAKDMGSLSAELQTRGIKVKREHKLINALSIECTGAEALELLDNPNVAKIELDRAVRGL